MVKVYFVKNFFEDLFLIALTKNNLLNLKVVIVMGTVALEDVVSSQKLIKCISASDSCKGATFKNICLRDSCLYEI